MIGLTTEKFDDWTQPVATVSEQGPKSKNKNSRNKKNLNRRVGKNRMPL
jgi:hypothetical protein